MRKKSLFGLVLISGILACGGVIQDKVSIKNNEKEVLKSSKRSLDFRETDVGRGIDVAYANYYCPNTTSIKNGASIFEDNWILENCNAKNIDYSINGSQVHKNCSYSLDEIANSANISYSTLQEVFLGEKNSFGAGAYTSLKNSISADSQKSLSKVVYRLSYYVQEYKYTLNNIANLDLHRQHLDSGYVNAVGNLFKNKISYSEFFGNYGTHIITSGLYGGSYDAYYIAYSDTYNFSKKLTSEYSQIISGKLQYENVPISADKNTNHKIELGLEKKDALYKDEVIIKSRGGKSNINATDISNFASTIENWYNSIEGNEGLIYITDYLPIWKMLPDEYNNSTNIELMKKYYKQYINSCYNNAKNDFLIQQEKISYSIDMPISDKDGTIKVQGSYGTKNPSTASGRTCIIDFENNTTKWSDRDAIYSNQIPDIDLLTKNSFKNMQVKVKCQMRKKDDGVQDFFVGTSTVSNVKVKSVQDATFSYEYKTITFDSIEMNLIFDESNKKIYITFGAHGNGFNAWYIKDVSAEITFSK